MNRFVSIIAAAALVGVMLTGCTSDGTAVTSASSGSESTASAVSGETMTGDGTASAGAYDKTFDGFVKYMTDNGFISGDGVDLTAAAIGASTGKRFTVSTPVSKHTIELYEYEDQTSEMALKTINNARTDGSFHLYESTENMTKYTKAAVSSDGRFLMLYTDSTENDEASDQKQQAAEAVQNFS